MPLTDPRTLGEVLLRWAAIAPDRVAYRFLDDRGEEVASATFSELDIAARKVAAVLTDRIAARANVLLLYEPGLEFVYGLLGCFYAGAVAVPCQAPGMELHTASAKRLQAIAGDAMPAAVLTSSACLASYPDLRARWPELRDMPWITSDEWNGQPSSQAAAIAVAADDVALLQYSSGSTSAPSGIMLSHRNILANQEMIRTAFGHTEQSIVVSWLPLHHDMGLIGGVLQPLYMGIPCILMSPRAFLNSPWVWLEAIDRYRATTSGAPDFAYDLCVRRVGPQRRQLLDLSSWQVAFNGSERVRASTIDAFADAFSQCGFHRSSLLPCYGLAEATLLVTGARPVGAEPILDDAGHSQVLVGCGAVAPGITLCIVDPKTRMRVGEGEVGEIWIAGANIARGYWRRPGRTKTTFRNALPGEPGAFMRTGDLGMLRDGRIFITGRLNDVIVLRGRKHHPEDLETSVEASSPAFRPGGCIAFAESSSGAERLVVVQELAARSASRSPELIARIQAALSEEHGITADEVILVPPRALPKTSSGKRQRSACRLLWRRGELPTIATSRSGPDVEADTVSIDSPALAPLTPGERLAQSAQHIALRVAKLRGIAPGDVDRSRELAAYGLDSLRFMQLVHMIEADFGVRLDLRAVPRSANVEQLSAMVCCALTTESPFVDAPPSDTSFALSPTQRALGFASKTSERPDLFSVAAAVRFGNQVQLAGLRWALARAIESHALLRARIVVRDGKPCVVVSEQAAVRLEHVDVRSYDHGQLEEELRSRANLAFDLERGPLARICAFADADECVTVLFVAHHMICDLRSFEILMEDIAHFYEGWRHGLLEAPLRKSGDYGSYVESQRIWLSGKQAEQSRSYWQSRLRDCPPLQLWHDRARPAIATHRGAHVHLGFDRSSAQLIDAAAQAHGVTPFNVLLAGFMTFLAGLSGQTDIAVGTPVTDRIDGRFSRTFGNFTNPVVIRAEIDPNDSFADVLRQVSGHVEDALAHRSVPFADLVERLNPPRVAGRPPLYQVMFVLQQTWERESEALGLLALDQGGCRVQMGSLEFEPLPIGRGISQVDLTLCMAKIGDLFRGTLEYNCDLFDRASVENIAARFVTAISGLCTDPFRRAGSMPLVDEFERARLLRRDDGRHVEEASASCLHERFRRWSSLTPNAVAVVTESAMLSYGNLDERSDRIAHALTSRGIGAGSKVAFCLTPSARVIVSILGILKAGAAYVALDPGDPAHRLLFFVEDSGSRLVIGEAGLPARLSQLAVECVEHDCLEQEAAGAGPYQCRVIPATAPAYLIYTSGSSGMPKGMIISHANVDRLFEATAERFVFGANDVWTLFHSPAFDFSVWEIWGALRHGGQLVVLPRPVTRSPGRLREFLVAHRVTVLSQTPSAFAQLARDVAANREADFCLRYVVLGGEALDVHDAGRWIEARGDTQPLIVNMYGITETTVHLTHRRIDSSDLAGHASPIGSALPGTKLYLLDTDLEPVPDGFPGEIFVAGPGLGHGYHNNPALTAATFLPNPHAKRPGERLYRTGDHALRRNSGDLVFCGRRDSQVKLRGFRIELKEIEAALQGHPEVGHAIVLQRPGKSGRSELVAYVVGEPRSGLQTELLEYVRRFLPSHMVPGRFAWMGSVPLTRNGKLNVKALQSIELAEPETAGTGSGPPTDLQRRLIGLWSEVLGVSHVGIDDSFFDLGGHSLLLEEMAARLPKLVGREVEVIELFRLPTVRALARFIDEDSTLQHDVAALGQARAAARLRLTGPQRARRQSRQPQDNGDLRDGSS